MWGGQAAILPRTPRYPLNINGWKMKCSFEMVPFLWGTCPFSGGYTFIGLQPQIWHSGTAERHGKTFGRGRFKNGSAKRLKNEKSCLVSKVLVCKLVFFWGIINWEVPHFLWYYRIVQEPKVDSVNLQAHFFGVLAFRKHFRPKKG